MTYVPPCPDCGATGRTRYNADDTGLRHPAGDPAITTRRVDCTACGRNLHIIPIGNLARPQP